MSFGKLLAAGKSFAGGQDAFRYRANPRAVLPKFISPKNPFVQSPNKDASERTVTPEVPAKSLPNQAADAGARAASPSRLSAAATRASVCKSALARCWSCIRLLNPAKLFNLFKRRAARSKPAIPHFGKPPMQAEFSLDRVRVVRNDLTDADLEVVEAGGRAVMKRPQQEGALGRLAARVFGGETM
jgi:hypothetical protein